MRTAHLYIGVITIIGTYGSSCADTLKVPMDYPTIQAALLSAQDGDTIAIAAGTYQGSYVDAQGMSLLITGETNPDGTPAVIIDGMQSGAVLQCNGGEDSTTIFRNLVLTNGSSYYGGGMTLYSGCSPRIENCHFINNIGTIDGGGVHLREDCNPEFIDCVFSDNTTSGQGGGIYCMDGSSPKLFNCTISNNTSSFYGGGIYCLNASNPIFTNCKILENTGARGGGLYCTASDPQVIDCTFSGNSGLSAGGGDLLLQLQQSSHYGHDNF